MTFRVFRIKTNTKGNNLPDLERLLNDFETDLNEESMKINHMLTTAPVYQDNHVLLIMQYGPKQD